MFLDGSSVSLVHLTFQKSAGQVSRAYRRGDAGLQVFLERKDLAGEQGGVSVSEVPGRGHEGVVEGIPSPCCSERVPGPPALGPPRNLLEMQNLRLPPQTAESAF